jgi:cell shape-determining protein MreC
VVKHVSPRFASVISVLSPDIKNQRASAAHRPFRATVLGYRYDPSTASVIDIAKHARVRPGDTVQTRGGDGIFPEGISRGRDHRGER